MKFRRQVVKGAIRVLLGGAVCAVAGCGSSNSGGGSSGGGSGGSSDSVPPTFAGLSTATVMDDGSIALAWDAASDNDTKPASIAYAVYVGNAPGAEDFSTPYSYTPAGASGATLSNITPGQSYYWVVRAIDQAGNEDMNMVEKVASPADITAPRFAGATVATVQTSSTVLVSWKPAQDDASTAAQITYQVFVSTSPDPTTFKFTKPSVTVKGAVTSALVTGLDPLSTYFFIARAVDAAGNQDDNTHVLHGTTPEGVPPVFAGLAQINPLPEGMKLYWLSALDNATDVANIVYNVYVTTNSAFTAADLVTPAYVSPPGAVTFVVPNLINQQRYSFLVRAQDTAGNTDSNTVVLSARALNGVDQTAPSFDGSTVTVKGDSPSALLATWTAGSDLVTDTADLVYSVYVSSTMDPIAPGTAPTLVTAPGATSVVIAGLASATTYYVTVRCSDQAGNTLANVISKPGLTLAGNPADVTPPTFSGAPVLTTSASLPSGMHVVWTAGSDGVTLPANLRYRVCASPLQTDCLGSSFPAHIYATSAAGATSLDLTGLISRTHYYVYVHAEDQAGNESVGDYGADATTPTSFTRDVNPIIFDKCNGCHTFSIVTTVGVGSSFVDTRLPVDPTLLAGTGGQNIVGDGIALVAKGNPRDSLIYRRINPLGLASAPFGTLAGAGAPDPSAPITNLYRGPQEPQNAQKIFAGALSPAEDGAIRDWITQGAFAN